MNAIGRLLGVDFGTVRLGLAVTDPDQRIASPFSTYTRRGNELDAAFFQELIQSERIAAIIVGLPIHTDGSEGKKAAEARAFGAWLAQQTKLPVDFWDERFTTVEAEQSLLTAGLTHKRRRVRRDRVAAQLMLQAYLETKGTSPTMPQSEVQHPPGRA